MRMFNRLVMLEKLVGSGKADSFAWYALALEYKSAARIDDAMRAFRHLREADPNYVPMYLMAGSMLQAAGRLEEAQDWIRAGIEKARHKGDQHADDELSDLLERISSP
jgi:tetratricopeptide (TPR) repeat protein